MSSQVRSAILAFVAGVAIVAVVGGVILLVRDSGGGTDAAVTGTPVPTNGPYPVLADGQFIDSLPSLATISSGLSAVSLPYSASKTDNIALVTITGEVSTVVPTAGPGTVTPKVRRFQALPWTTYTATVDQWIKGGNGATDVKISVIGGLDYDGARLLSGTFLPQVGRKYLLSLDTGTADTPGGGDFMGAAAGWGSFEVTDGKIHVLNESTSHSLMGVYNLTPLDDFLSLLSAWIAGPPAASPTVLPTFSPVPRSETPTPSASQ